MRERGEEIRAERDEFKRYTATKPYDGLWKQIAIGILAAYSVIVITSTIGWVVFALFATGTVRFDF